MNKEVLNKILDQLNCITEDQQEMKQEFASMKQEFAGMQKDITGMKQDIADMKKHTEDIPSMKVAILDTNDRVKRIEATVEKHDLTLDLLSRRSIDQEAELKRIK